MGKELIDRNLLRESIEEIDWYHKAEDGKLAPGAATDYEAYVRYAEVELIVKTVPAEIKRKSGHWKYKTMTVPGGKGQTYSKWCCSVCKHKFKVRSRYCPDCGAEMEVEG